MNRWVDEMCFKTFYLPNFPGFRLLSGTTSYSIRKYIFFDFDSEESCHFHDAAYLLHFYRVRMKESRNNWTISRCNESQFHQFRAHSRALFSSLFIWCTMWFYNINYVPFNCFRILCSSILLLMLVLLFSCASDWDRSCNCVYTFLSNFHRPTERDKLSVFRSLCSCSGFFFKTAADKITPTDSHMK